MRGFRPTAPLGFLVSIHIKARPTGRAFILLLFLSGLRRCCRRGGRSHRCRRRCSACLSDSGRRRGACRRVHRITRPEEQCANDQDGRRDESHRSRAHSSPRPHGGAGIKIVSHKKSPIMVTPFQTITFWKCSNERRRARLPDTRREPMVHPHRAIVPITRTVEFGSLTVAAHSATGAFCYRRCAEISVTQLFVHSSTA